MIRLKDLFYAIAYCNQHIKTHKSECKKHAISPSRFYNVKEDIIRYLIENQKTFGLGVIITSYEIQHSDPKDIELVGIKLVTQSLNELHVHQLYSHYNDLVPADSLPEPKEFVPNHTFESEWDESEFIEAFDTIIKWAKQQKIENFYPTLRDSFFLQKMQRWYWNLYFAHDPARHVFRIKKKRASRRTIKEFGIKEFRNNATNILNDMESS